MSSKFYLIYSSDIDYVNDILEISVELVKEQTESYELVKSRINMKNLNRDREQEEYWSLGSLGTMRVKYKIKQSTINHSPINQFPGDYPGA